MLLAIDAGNTNITIGCFRDGTLTAVRRFGTDPQATADELDVALRAFLALDDTSLDEAVAVAVASVVPSITLALETVAERHHLAAVIASAGTVPLPVRVDRPAEVGADRLVNALAAARIHGTPAIVIDAGTATTFDCVAPDGAYVGGAILPGPELGLEALATRTAQLPRVELRAPDRAIGRSTVEAMQAGLVLGYHEMIRGLLNRIRVELADAAAVDPATIQTILTGGLATAPWAAGVEAGAIRDPHLTLRGLALLHAEVSGGEPLELGLP
jgi:type III pantothenate kinase